MRYLIIFPTFLLIVEGGFGGNFAANGGGQENYSSYESVSGSSAGYGAALGGANTAGNFYSSASSSFADVGNTVGQDLSSGAFLSDAGASAGLSSSNFASSATTTTYATDAQGLFKDPNPQVIRRANPEAARSYIQRVVVKFLQPPPVPPPGVKQIFLDNHDRIRIKSVY